MRRLIYWIFLLALTINIEIYAYQWPISSFNSQHQINGALGEYRGDHLHKGIDIQGTEGTDIYPVEDGKVIEVGNNYVRIESYGVINKYWHLKSIPNFVEYSSYVVAGVDRLGVTDSANHLHFEDGEGAYNPLDWIYPFNDYESPVVEDITFVKNGTENTYPSVDATMVLSGKIDIKAWSYDPRINSSGYSAGKGVGVYKIGYHISDMSDTIIQSAVYNYEFSDAIYSKDVSYVYAAGSSYDPVNFIYWVTNNGNSDNFWNSSSVNDGRYKIVVSAQDIEYGYGANEKNVIVDNNSPVISNLAPVNGSYTDDATPIISATLSDVGSGIDVNAIIMKIDGAAVSATKSETSVNYTPMTNLSEVSHNIYVEVKDRIGRLQTASWSFTVDTIAPVISNVTGNTAGTTGESVAISADIAEANLDYSKTRIYYTPIGGSETWDCFNPAWGYTMNYSNNKVGDISYYITAVDLAGNSARAPVTGTYKITVTDNDKPIISNVPVDFITNQNVDLRYECDIEDNVTWPWWDCTITGYGPFTEEGEYFNKTITVQDAATNTATATFPHFEIDKTPPDVLDENKLQFNVKAFTVGEPGAEINYISPLTKFYLEEDFTDFDTIWYKIDTEEIYHQYFSTAPIQFISGHHTISYYAKDKTREGNLTPVLSFAVDVDGTVPETELVSIETRVKDEKTGIKYDLESFTYRITAEDGGSGVKEIRVSVDGGAEQVYTNSGLVNPFVISEQFLLGKQEGEYTIKYYAVDNVGNTGAVKTYTAKIPHLPEIAFPPDSSAQEGGLWFGYNQTGRGEDYRPFSYSVTATAEDWIGDSKHNRRDGSGGQTHGPYLAHRFTDKMVGTWDVNCYAGVMFDVTVRYKVEVEYWDINWHHSLFDKEGVLGAGDWLFVGDDSKTLFERLFGHTWGNFKITITEIMGDGVNFWTNANGATYGICPLCTKGDGEITVHYETKYPLTGHYPEDEFVSERDIVSASSTYTSEQINITLTRGDGTAPQGRIEYDFPKIIFRSYPEGDASGWIGNVNYSGSTVDFIVKATTTFGGKYNIAKSSYDVISDADNLKKMKIYLTPIEKYGYVKGYSVYRDRINWTENGPYYPDTGANNPQYLFEWGGDDSLNDYTVAEIKTDTFTARTNPDIKTGRVYVPIEGWATFKEDGTKNYKIEYSTNEIDWQSIKISTDNVLDKYYLAFWDVTGLNGTHYIKLMVDGIEEDRKMVHIGREVEPAGTYPGSEADSNPVTDPWGNVEVGLWSDWSNDTEYLTITPIRAEDFLFEPPPENYYKVLGDVIYEFKPSMSFNVHPVVGGSYGTLTMRYEEADIPDGTAEDELSIYHFNPATEEWEVLDDLERDTAANTITAPIDCFSYYFISPTVDITPPEKPAELTANNKSVADWDGDGIYLLDWKNPVDLSGIKGAYRKTGLAPVNNTDGIFTESKPATVRTFLHGANPLYLWLEDRAGNTSYEERNSITLRYDGTAPEVPVVANSVEENPSAPPLLKGEFSSSDPESGIAGYKYAVGSVGGGWLGAWEISFSLPEGVNVYPQWNGYAYRLEGKRVYYGDADQGSATTWTETVSLPVEDVMRYSVSICQGWIYVIGGLKPEGYYYNQSDEIYYAKINTDGSISNWSVQKLFEPLALHASAVIGNRLYVIGGENENTGVTNKVYFAEVAPETGLLSQWTKTISLPEQREWHSAIADNNRIYVIGGYDKNWNKTDTVYYAEIDPASGHCGIWKPITPLPEGIANHKSAVSGGKIYVKSDNLTYSADIQPDGRAGGWVKSDSQIPYDIGRGFSTVKHNNRVYFIGGENSKQVYKAKLTSSGLTEGFDIQRQEPLPDVRYDVAAVSHQGKIYVIGGKNSAGAPQRNIYYTVPKLGSEIAYYDGDIEFWKETTGLLPSEKYYHKAVVCMDWIYVIGGQNNEVYRAKPNPDGDITHWSEVDDLPSGAECFSGVGVYQNFIYVTGGYPSGNRVYRAEVKEDGSFENGWAHIDFLPDYVRLNKHSLETVGNKMYIIGGEESGVIKKDVYFSELDESGGLGEWKNTASLADAGKSAEPVFLDDKIFLFGGETGAGYTRDIVYTGVNLGGEDLTSWTETGESAVSLEGLSLIPGQEYFFQVKAQNGAGTWSEVGTGKGTKIKIPEPEVISLKLCDRDSGSREFTNERIVNVDIKATDFAIESLIEDNYFFTGASWQPLYGRIPFTFVTQGDGEKTIYCQVKDIEGKVSITKTDTIILDTTIPEVMISEPLADSFVSGEVTVNVAGTDGGSGIDYIKLFIDEALVSTISSRSGSYIWNTLTEPEGGHTISAIAYDKAGNVSEKKTIAVKVDNVPFRITMAGADPATFNTYYGEKSNIFFQTSEEGKITINIEGHPVVGDFVSKKGLNCFEWDGADFENGTYQGLVSGVSLSNPGQSDERAFRIKIDTAVPYAEILFSWDTGDYYPDTNEIGAGIIYRISGLFGVYEDNTVKIRRVISGHAEGVQLYNSGWENFVANDRGRWIESPLDETPTPGIFKFEIQTSRKEFPYLPGNSKSVVKIIGWLDKPYEWFNIKREKIPTENIPAEAVKALSSAEPAMYIESDLYKYTPEDMTFTAEHPYCIELPLEAEHALPLLKIYRFDDVQNEWVRLEKQFVDEENNRIVAEVNKLGTFAILSVEDNEASEINNLTAAPNPFSPNRDGTDETTVISFNLSDNESDYIPWTSVEIFNQSGGLIRTIFKDYRRETGQNNIIWDGLDDEGKIVPVGDYKVKITASDLAGNSSESEAVIKVRYDYIVDDTPPTTPVVDDDGDYTNSTAELYCQWQSIDPYPESGITDNRYQLYSITPQGLGEWIDTGSHYPEVRREAQAVILNDFMYIIGGERYEGDEIFRVDYNKIKSDGSIDPQSWIQTADLPEAMSRFSALSYKGYIYLIGGYYTKGVFYTKPDPVTGQISNWTATSSLPLSEKLYENSAFIYNSRIYVTGGFYTEEEYLYGWPVTETYSETRIYFSAPIGEDGTIGCWGISGVSLQEGGQYRYAAGFGGKIYAIEDEKVSYASIDPVSGDIEAPWHAGPVLPEKLWAPVVFAYRDVLYVFGGDSSTADELSDRIYYARINGDGSLGAWNTDTLPGSRYFHDVVVRGKDIYLIDGIKPGSDHATDRTIYRAPIAEDINVVKSWTSTGLEQQVLINNLSLEAGKRYYFDVRTTNGGNLTSAVGASDGILAGMPVPPRVENLVVSNPGCGETLILNWAAVSGDVTGYNIYQSTAATAGYIKINTQTVADNSYTVEALKDGTAYFYRVAAFDSRLREGAKSLPASGVPADELPPSAAADFQALASDETSVTFCWTATGDNGISGDITGGKYWIKYSAIEPITTDAEWNRAPYELISATDTPTGQIETVAVQGLTANQIYYFALRLCDEAGNWSAVSNCVSAKPGVDYSSPVSSLEFAGGKQHPAADGYYASVDTKYKITALDPYIEYVPSGVDFTEYRIDGGGWQVYTEPFGLAEGAHTIEYYGQDKRGNKEEPAKTEKIYVDNTVPEAQLVIAEPKYEMADKVYITAQTPLLISAIDPVISGAASGISRAQYTVDKVNWQPYEEPFYITDDGTYEINFSAEDNVGNKSSVQTSKEIVVDTIPPAFSGITVSSKIEAEDENNILDGCSGSLAGQGIILGSSNGENIALDKGYVYSIEPDVCYVGIAEILLTDGATGRNVGWEVGGNDSIAVDIVVDLSAIFKTNKIRCNSTSIYYVPDRMEVYTSLDNVNFDYAGYSEETAAATWMEIEFPAREARYVKFRLKQSGHGKPSWWLFVSELEIYEAIGLLEGTVETAWKNIHPDSQLTNFSPIQQLNQGNITYQYSTDGQIWSDVSALSQADTSAGKIKFIAGLSRSAPESVSPYLDCIQFDMGDGIFVSPETAGLEPVTIKFMTSETLREEPVVKVGEHYAGFADFSDGIYTYNYIVTPLDLPGEYTITVEGTDIAGNNGIDTTGRIDIDWIDDVPPVSSVVLGEPADGDIIGMNTPVEIEASDDISGVKEIKYRVNSEWKTYTGSFTVSSANSPRTMTVPEINWSRLELPPEPNSLFVCSENKIIKFNMFGEKELEVTIPGGTPSNLTYDSETKYIYIADTINNRIARTVDGSNWEFQYAHNVGWAPTSATIDKYKNLYVPSYYTIWKFEFGQYIGYGNTLIDYLLYTNTDIDYDPSEDMLYIAESYYGRIYKAKADGSEYVQGYGRGGATGIDFNSTDKSIYLADNEWNTIIRTNIDGSIRESIGAYGSGNGKFKHPWDVAIDEQTDILYVSDTGNNRLVKTKMDGSVWEVFTEVTSPKGIFFSIPEPKYMDVAQVIDAGESVGWRYMSWETSDSGAYLKTRTGNTPQPDETWSDWSDNFNASAGTRIVSSPGRYLQIAAGIQDAGDILPEITNIRLDVVPVVEISHYSVDLRGNIELAKQTLVYLDNLAPGSPNELVYEILNNNTVSIVWQLNLENDFDGYNLYRNGQKLNESCFSGVAYIDEDLSLGEYTYQLTAVDLFGNESEPSQISVSIADTVPPATAFIPSRDFYIKDGKNYASDEYNYGFQATDAFTGVDHIEVNIDEQGYIVYTDSIVFTTTGIHTIKYRAVDNAENRETEKSITIYVDANKPQTTAFFTGTYFETEGKFYIIEQTQISFVVADPYINGVSSGLDFTEYRTNGGAWQAYTAPFTVSDNTNLLEFRSTDNVGNEEVVKNISIGFDTLPPVTSVKVFGPSRQDEKLWISSLTPVGFETQDNTKVDYTKFKIGYTDWDIYQSEFNLAPEIKKAEYKDAGEAAWQSGELNDLKIDAFGNVELKEYPSYLFVAQSGKIVKISICNGIEIERETLDSLYVPSIPYNALSYVEGISHDPVNDFVYLTNTYCDGIIKTKMDGTEITTFGELGSGINRFRDPYGIFYDPNSEYLYIADTGNHRIVKMKTDGSDWQTIGGFNSPRDVYYDSSTDFVYIADYNNNRIVKTKMDGSEWTSLDGLGNPAGVYYDSFSDYIYVTEYLRCRIVKVKMNGQGKEIFGSHGSGQGQFNNPQDVYYDSNEDVIYVADTYNSRVVKTNMTGSVWQVSSGLRYPRGVCYESAEIEGFISNGEFVSRIVDAGDIVEWGLIEWQSQTPFGTTISLCTRTGNTLLPDTTWSDWSPLYTHSGSQISSPAGRFIQYKAVFATNDNSVTPSLNEVTLKIKEGVKDEFVVSYYSTDIFGNQEEVKSTVVKVDSIVPEAPQQIAYEVADMTTVNFSWQANTETDLAGYYIYRDGDKLNDTPLCFPVYQETKAIAGISQLYWVTALDKVGNESAPSQKVNVITLPDETAPVSTITVSGYSYISPDGNNYAALASSFSITAADDLSGVDYIEYKIGDGDIQRYQEQLLVVGEGEYFISYRAVDRAGNQESFSEYRIIIDSAAPFSILTASRGLYNDGEKDYANSDVHFILSSTDNLSGVKDIFVAVKDDFQTYSSSFTLSDEGDYQIKIYAKDNVNNSEEVKTYNICIDTTPPALSEILILPENSSLGIVDIYFQVSEPLVKNPGITINGNPAEFISYASPFHYQYEVTGFDTEGPAEVIVSVEDFAGNKAVDTSGELLIDYTPPDIAVYSPLGGDRYITAGNKIIIAYDVSDNFDSSPDSRAYLTNLTEGTTMAVFAYQIINPGDISPGQWTMTIEACDSAGNNISTTTAVFEVSHDVLPPRTRLSLGEPRYWQDPVFITDGMVITLTADDDLVEAGDGIGIGVEKIQWRIDEGDWLIYEAEQTLSFAEGEHRIEYYSVDGAGNTEQIKYFDVVIDSSAPVSRIKIGEPELLFEGKTFVTAKTPFVIGSDDNLSGTKSIEYRLNYLPFQPYAGSFSLGENKAEQERDNFNQLELSDNWRWQRGNTENRSLTEERESLIIYTANGSLQGAENSQENILLRNMPVYGNMVVETKSEFNPEYEGQEAGIYIYQNDDNYIKLVKTERDNKNYVAAAMEKNGQYSESVSIEEFYEKDIYLRIRREETNYRLYYSTNGLSWFKTGEFDAAGMTAEAGIGACNGIEAIASGARTAAKFDYFSLYRTEPSNLSDGEYALSYYAEDNVGNKEEQKSVTVKLDDSPPEIEIVSPAGDGRYIATKDKINIVFDVSDAGPYNEAAYLTVVDADDPDKIGLRVYVKPGDSIEPLDLPTYGHYKLTVEAIDWAGHKVTRESSSFEVLWDILPPRTEIASGQPKYITETSTFVAKGTQFGLSAVDDMVEVGDAIGLGVEETRYSINQGTFSVYTSSFTLCEEGENVIKYYSVDVIGNTEAEKTLSVIADFSAAETGVLISAPVYENYITSRISITLIAEDKGVIPSGVKETKYSISQSPFIGYDSPFTISGDDGIYTVNYYSADNVLNAEIVKSITVKLDNSPPETEIIAGLPQYIADNRIYISPRAEIELAATDPSVNEAAAGLENIRYRIDGGEWKIYTGTFTLTEGVRAIEYYATDNIGNAEEIKAQIYYVDDTAPETSIAISQPKYLPDGSIYITSSAEITLSAIDPVAENVSCGVALTKYRILSSTGIYEDWRIDESINITGPDGVYTIEYYSIDNLENTEIVKSITVKLDNTQPITTITAGEPKYASGERVYITSQTEIVLTAEDPIVNGVACGVLYTKYRIDGGGWIVYQTEQVPLLQEGIRKVEYCSIDNLGNKEITREQVYYVDATASLSSLALGEPFCASHSIPGVEHSTAVVSSLTPLTITAIDPVIKEVASGVKEIKWRIAGGGWQTASSAVAVFQIEDTFADGEYKIEYYSADNLLNTEPAKDRTVILDNTAPEVYLIFPSTANTGLCQMINGTVTVRGTVTDPHLKYFNLDYRAYNGTVWQTAVSTKEIIVENGDLGEWNTAGLDDGWYVLRLQAVDCVNNASETEVEVYAGQPYKLMEIGSKGKGDGEFNHPGYAAIDEDGGIYVSDTENGRVQKFSSGGEHLLTFGKGILNEPTGIAVDNAGMVYIADRNNDRVVKIEQTSNDSWQLVGEITGLNKPHGICVSSGLIYIADRNNDRIQVYDSALARVAEIETGIEVELNKPQGVFAVKDGEIYISDRNNDRALVLSSTGSLKQKIEGFNKPDGVALGGRGFLFVSDTNNDKVKMFTPEGVLAAVTDGDFNKPGGVAVFNGELYVVDSLNDRVVKYGAPPKDMSGGRTVMVLGAKRQNSTLAVFELKEVYAYPNPAKRVNPKIHFDCGVSDASVNLRIFTIAGEQVFGCDMSNNYVAAKNAYEYEWDSTGKASGVYIYLIKADRNGVSLKKTGKMAVIK